MEITKELRCKAIAAYLDCKAEIGTAKVHLFGINSGEGELYFADLLEDGSIDYDALPDTLYTIEECTLLLTPLSKIIDEHFAAIAKLAMWHYDSDYDCSEEATPDIESIEHNEYGAHIDIESRCFAGYVSLHDNLVFISDYDTELEQISYGMALIIDYLRPLGYDLGYGPIKSLIESGIAKDATL